MLEIINQSVGNIADAVDNIKKNGIKNSFSFKISCSNLNDYTEQDIRKSVEFEEIFRRLLELNGPVVYWFEIKSNIKNIDIRERLLKYKENKNSKSTPAMKKNFSETSNCLYVGKVKKGAWGRMIQHLGYYKVQRTQGLQLFHWAKDLDLELEVHLYEFEKEMEDLVSVIEIDLAKKLKPITGKHK